MTEPWPPAPVGVSGSVVLRLLGLKLATIRLDLVIYATDRLARWLAAGHELPVDAPTTGLGAAPPARPASRRPTRPPPASIPASGSDGGSGRRAELSRGNGASVAQGDLREILQLLTRTSKLLE